MRGQERASLSPERKTEPAPKQEPLHYEPPRVERVLSPMELEREVLYAGLTKLSLPGA